MSYCRWSSDNFNCDLYCFEHVGGWWQTYVANSRQRAWLRALDNLFAHRIKCDDGQVFKCPRTFRWTWYLPHWMTHKRIGLPFDGHSFQDPTEEHMFDRIKQLHTTGYHVPKRLLDEIDQHFKSLPK